jgi:hypothetical protein
VVGHCILLLGIFFAAGVLSRRSVPLGSPPLAVCRTYGTRFAAIDSAA